MRALLSVNPIDPGRKRLRQGLDVAVVGYERDPGIAPDVVDPRVRNLRGVALQRAVISGGDLRAVGVAMLGGEPVHVTLVVVKDHDDVAR